MHVMHSSAPTPAIGSFDWNLLLAFEALLVERNVTRAARKIGLSQSATSHALARLRDQLGDALFTPTPQGMVPTKRALELEGPIREAIALVRRSLSPAPPFDPLTARRTFTIAGTDFMTLAIVPRLLRDLAARAPLFDLAVRSSDEAGLSALLAGHRDLDIGVDLGGVPGVRTVRLFDDVFVCVRRKPKGKRLRPLTLDRFASTGHLLVSPTGSGDAPVDIALRKLGRARRIVLRLPHFLAAPIVLAESDYVMTVPSRLAEVFAAMLPLVIEPPPLPVPGFSVEMAWHARSDDDPAHRFLRDAIVATTSAGDRAQRPASPARRR